MSEDSWSAFQPSSKGRRDLRLDHLGMSFSSAAIPTTRTIGKVLSVISLVLFSYAIALPQRSQAALSHPKAPASKTLYIVSSGDLTAIDVATGQEIFRTGSVYDAKLSADGSLLYLIRISQPNVTAVDSVTAAERWQARLKEVSGYNKIGTEFGSSPDNRFVYFPTHFSGNVGLPMLSVVDAAHGVELAAPIQLPVSCHGEVLTPRKGKFIYVNCFNQLVRIDTTTQTLKGTFELSARLEGASFSPDGRRLYLFDGNNGLSIFDPAQSRVVRQLSFEPNELLLKPQSWNVGIFLASSADGKRLLIAQNRYDGQTEPAWQQTPCLLRVFDTVHWRKVSEFIFPHRVNAVSLSSDGSAIYAAIATTRSRILGLPLLANTVVELNGESGQIRSQFPREYGNIKRLLLGP